MVIAHHLIWMAYGRWLPNDPRGSMSKTIASDLIAELGELHYGRKKIQPASRDIQEFYECAREVLKFPLMTFSAEEIEILAAAFADVIRRCQYTCYACAIMPDHVHAVVRKHRDYAEDMIAHFQNASRQKLLAASTRPSDHPVWGGPGWKVFLDTPDDIRRTVVYVEQNPIKQRLSTQRWGFVEEYDGWPHARKK